MQLDAAQDKIVRSKPLSTSIVSGVGGTGKTTSAVYRALFLKNNYCLYDDDKLLILTKDSKERDFIRNLYNQVEDETRYDFKTLLTNNVDRVEILTIGDIVNRYYFDYTNHYKKCYKIIQEESEILEIINEAVTELKEKYGYIKLLEQFIGFFKDEVAYIKACRFISLEAYQMADRIGRRYRNGQGPARLLKNSKSRKIIYDLYDIYNKKLAKRGVIDCEDIAYFALKQVNESKGCKFTHIIIDGAETLTKSEVDFIKALSNRRKYSTNTYFVDKTEILNYRSWFIKGRKQIDLELDTKVKSYRLLKTYSLFQETTDFMQERNIPGSMEKYEYLDLKHRRRFNFKRDSDIHNELIFEDEREETIIRAEELRTIPVYSDIAAGEPIFISSEMEDEFYLPEYWLKGSKDCFMLKVRGDSMIGANIFDSDFVVIKKQSTAQNGDIVAVDLNGSATLKRLSFKKGIALLMPENEKYEPIFIHDKEVSILGIAVGVIKNKYAV